MVLMFLYFGVKMFYFCVFSDGVDVLDGGGEFVCLECFFQGCDQVGGREMVVVLRNWSMGIMCFSVVYFLCQIFIFVFKYGCQERKLKGGVLFLLWVFSCFQFDCQDVFCCQEVEEFYFDVEMYLKRDIWGERGFKGYQVFYSIACSWFV